MYYMSPCADLRTLDSGDFSEVVTVLVDTAEKYADCRERQQYLSGHILDLKRAAEDGE